MRPTEAFVDLGAIGRNIERLIEQAAPASVCAVTKADAYGHGSVACSRVALDAGASMIAVALVEEGIELRRSGVRAPILLLSEPRPGEMFEVVEAGLTPTVYSPVGVAALVAAAGSRKLDAPVDVHLNLDTGMNRVGLRPGVAFDESDSADYVVEAAAAVADKPGLRLGGIWTHLAIADELDRPETAMQLGRFNQLLEAVGEFMDDDVILHASNSAGLIAHDEARFDMVRVGIASYGIEPARGLGADLGLEPAMSLTSELSMVKPVFAGEGVSYGLRHTFASDTIIGTVPMGYADGLRRDSHLHGATLLVGGKHRPIVGVTTMDQTMVDLGPDSTAQAGDPVVIIGSQGDAKITVHDIADRLGTIPYEIVCDIGRRVRRRYL
jgi:alanine racemase